jgi:hypothetical protein
MMTGGGLLSSEETAALLGVALATLVAWRAVTSRGGPPFVRMGGRDVYDPQAVAEWRSRSTARNVHIYPRPLRGQIPPPGSIPVPPGLHGGQEIRDAS